MRKFRQELLRFFVVNVGGVAADVTAAYLLHRQGLSLAVAAGISVTLVAILVYFAHEFWTFTRPGARFAYTRLVQFLLLTVMVLLTREAALWIMHHPLGLEERYPLAQLIVASGISFAFSFIATKYFIFRERKPYDLPG